MCFQHTKKLNINTTSSSVIAMPRCYFLFIGAFLASKQKDKGFEVGPSKDGSYRQAKNNEVYACESTKGSHGGFIEKNSSTS